MNNLSGKKETLVKVTFYDPSTGSQFKVGRKIRLRANDSYDSIYLLNDKVSSLTEIHEELLKHNVSGHGYNVVMQGDVTRIISMSPLERRRIIDELAGVAQFDRKIDEAKGEIQSAESSMEKHSVLIVELSDRLKTLGGEREKALKYSKLKGDLHVQEALSLKARRRDLQEALEQLKHDLEIKVQEKSELILKLGELSDTLLNIESSAQAIAKAIAEKSPQDLNKDIEELKTKITRSEASVEFLGKQSEDFQKRIERLQKDAKLSTGKVNDLDLQAQKVERKTDDFQNQIKRLEAARTQLQESIMTKSHEGSDASGELEKLQIQLTNETRLEADLSAERKLHLHRKEDLAQMIKADREELEKTLYEIQSLERKISAANLKAIEERIAMSDKYLGKLKREAEGMIQERKKAQEDLRLTENELNKLDAKSQYTQHWGRALDGVLRLGKAGVYGVLAQLGTVEDQYRLALETAAGNRLKSIVVEDDALAAELIEYLRQHSLGRATFLPLNKLKTFDLPSLPYLDGVVDWAANLVDGDPRFKKAFSHAFGSTLVFENLQSARRALGKYRLVTLKGDLLETSGAMTGGSQVAGSNVSFGREDEANQDKLKANSESLKRQLINLDRDLAALENEMEEAKKELEESRFNFVREKSAIDNLSANYHAAKASVTDLQTKLTTRGGEREALENRLEALRPELERAQQNIKALHEALLTLTPSTKSAELEEALSQAQALDLEIKKLDVSQKNTEIEAASMRKEKQLLQEQLSEGEKEIQKAHEQIVDLQAKRQEQLDSLKELGQDLYEKDRELRELLAESQGLLAEKENLNKEMIRLSSQKGSLSENLGWISQEVADLKTRNVSLGLQANGLEADLLAYEDVMDEPKESSEFIKHGIDALRRSLNSLEPVNMKAIDEFAEAQEKIKDMEGRIEALQKEKVEIEKRISDYQDHKYSSFSEAFAKVNEHFREIFAELSYGYGELSLEDPQDPFKGGLIIQARPRNKKMQRLEAMSGGEKSLTALSFIFALQWHNPAPFYAFDEVDMFLDGLNVDRLAKMVRKQANLAQFIVVSLRKPMLQQSDRSIGVCMSKDGFSRVTGMKVKEAKPIVPPSLPPLEMPQIAIIN